VPPRFERVVERLRDQGEEGRAALRALRDAMRAEADELRRAADDVDRMLEAPASAPAPRAR